MFKRILAILLAVPFVQIVYSTPSFAGSSQIVGCASAAISNGGAGGCSMSGGGTVSAVLGFVSASPQESRFINRFWWVAGSNRADAQLEGVGDAVRNSIGGVQANNYVDENSFSLSSRGLAAFAADKDKRTAAHQSIITSALKDGSTSQAAVAEQSRFNIWLNGRFNHFDGDDNAFDANIGSFNVGADYRVSQGFVLGALAGYSGVDFDPEGDGSLDADTFSIGGYFGAKLGSKLVAEGFVAYTRSDYDEAIFGQTGDYDADGITAALRVHGSFSTDNLTIQPRASISINAEDQEAFVSNTGTAVDSENFSGAQISIGPRVFFDNVANGSVRPWVEARYDLYLTDSTTFDVTGTDILSDVSSASLQAGFDAQIGSGTLRVSGNVGGLGSGEFTSYGATGQYRVSF